MTDDDLEKRIDAAIREKVAAGWRLRPGVTFDEDSKCCCPLGAIGSPSSMDLGRRYGFVSDFIDGFDNKSVRQSDTETRGYKMGARFRARWMAGEYDPGAE